MNNGEGRTAASEPDPQDKAEGPAPDRADDNMPESSPKSDEKAAGGSDDEDDPFAVVRKNPYVELLTPGAFGKRFPYRCLVCTSKQFPFGKIGELSEANSGVVKHFLGQHLKCATHQKNVLKAQRADDPMEFETVPCEGLCVNDKDTAGVLYVVRHEFHLWASVANFEKFATHSYNYDGNKHSWYVRASTCAQSTVPSQARINQACPECIELGKAHGIARAPIRYAIKHYAAELLNARLFQGEAGVEAPKHVLSLSKHVPCYVFVCGCSVFS